MYKNIFLKKYFKFFSFGLLFFFLIFTTLNTSTKISFAQTIGANGNEEAPVPPPAPGNSQTTSMTENQRNCQAQGKVYNGTECVPAEQMTGFSSCIPLPYYFSFTECLGNITNAIFYYIFKFIYYAIVYPILLISSFVFDFTVYSTVVHFRSNFSELRLGGVGTFLASGANVGFIYYLWGIIRDMLNIIIFILIIYHAVRSMFEGFEGTKSKFISLLVFSIITNFSLLMVKLAIDVSNILTLQVYTLAVKPSGTDSIGAFRTSSGQGPANYGEFIRNSVDLDRLVASNNVGERAQNEIGNMQDTFMFQLGRLVTMVGVIYILLFMTGLLIARAISFLYAMILSPLLAADLFFSLISKNNPLLTEVKEGITSITSKIKFDFYDALVKGPALMFFIFLIGLFAESIMSPSLMDSMGSAFQSATPSNVPGIIGQNLAVFFKFVLFFFLAKKSLEFLQSIKLGEKAGTMMNGWGTKFVGGAARWTGYGLQNTVGRAAANKNGVIGSRINRLQESKLVQNWKNADSKSLTGWAKKGIGGGIFKAADSLKTGTFDAGNLASALNKKTGGALGNAVKGAIGSEDYGTRATDRITRDKAALTAREDVRKREEEEARKSFAILKADQEKAEEETDVEFGKLKTKLSTFNELMKTPEDFTIEPTTGLRMHIGTGISMDASSYDDFEKNLKKYKDKDADILLKIKEANEKAGKKAQSIAEDRAGDRADKIVDAYKSGERRGVGFIGKTQDVLAGRDKPFKSIFGEGQTTKDLRIETARSTQKAVKDKLKENNKIRDFITGTFNSSVSSLYEDLNEITKRQIAGVPAGPTQVTEIAKINAEKTSLEAELKAFIGSVPKLFYTSSKADLGKNLETFDKEGFKKIMEAKKKVHEHIINVASKLAETSGLDRKLNTIIRNSGRRTTSLAEMEETYKKSKPAETKPEETKKPETKSDTPKK